MEDLLNKVEISDILNQVKKEKFSNDKIIHLGQKKTSIIIHSKDSGLILIHGNKDTGLEHIFNRHSLMSRMHKWSDAGKMDNPSKFRLENAPIDYLTIANKIFQPKNKNIKNNQRPDDFDLYAGEYLHIDSIKVEYTLLTYKDTGIIHSFFLSSNKKPFNPKKIIDLRKGWTLSEYNPAKCLQTFSFPYFDSDKRKKAKVIVKCNLVTNIEDWYVELYNEDGSLKFKKLVDQPNYLKMGIIDKASILDFGNTNWIEKIIKDLLNKH